MKIFNMDLIWTGHSGILIKLDDGKNIYIDPFKLNPNLEVYKADIILITHSHYDHCSVEDIKKILKKTTKVIGPADILSQTRQIGDLDFSIVEPQSTIELDDLRLEAIPAYNIDKPFHEKSQGWMGYILEINGKRIYHAGDTDLIPEMNNIETDIALLPVSGKFVMTAEEAVKAAEIIKPKTAIPIHYGEIIGDKNDALKFVSLCREKGIIAIILSLNN